MNSTAVKIFVTAVIGEFIAVWAEPHLQRIVKPQSELGRQAVASVSIGVSALAVWPAVGKIYPTAS